MSPCVMYTRVWSEEQAKVGYSILFHVVVPDGLFVAADDGVTFQRLPAPDDADVEALLHRCAARVVRMLRQEVADDELSGDALAALEQASLSSRPTSGGETPTVCPPLSPA